MNLTISEKLMYSTIRIECKDTEGNISTGTGFFFNFLENPADKTSVPAIITNKHVVEGSVIGEFLFTLSDNQGNPLDRCHHRFTVKDFESAWRFHPDPEVDLCVMPIANIIRILMNKNQNPFYIPFFKDLIPTIHQLETLGAMEELVMVGYPNGIWDSVNNQPILRRGITATHPNKDYLGKKEFMVDMACFPGSSGSPVLIFNPNSYQDKMGFYMRSRILLMGILYAGPQHTATGEIEVVTVPTRQVPISISRIPNNLGMIIKSERILELEELLK